MEIALFFGSFNPVHQGHLVIAQAVLNQSLAKEVWFVISPQNPFKNAEDLIGENERLEMVKMSIETQPLFKACTVEFDLPKPNYTIDTLNTLTNKFPQNTFKLLIGEDNLVGFHLWNDYKEILNQVDLLVYPRPKTPDCELKIHPKVKMLNVPMFDISATYIRSLVQEGKSIKFMVSEKVEDFIVTNKLFSV